MTGAVEGAGAEVAAGDGRLRSEPTFCMGFVSVKSMGSCSSRLEAGMDLGRGRVAVAAVVAAGSRRVATRPREVPLVVKNGLEEPSVSRLAGWRAGGHWRTVARGLALSRAEVEVDLPGLCACGALTSTNVDLADGLL